MGDLLSIVVLATIAYVLALGLREQLRADRGDEESLERHERTTRALRRNHHQNHH
jgi:hypothetical protein